MESFYPHTSYMTSEVSKNIYENLNFGIVSDIMENIFEYVFTKVYEVGVEKMDLDETEIKDTETPTEITTPQTDTNNKTKTNESKPEESKQEIDEPEIKLTIREQTKIATNQIITELELLRFNIQTMALTYTRYNGDQKPIPPSQLREISNHVSQLIDMALRWIARNEDLDLALSKEYIKQTKPVTPKSGNFFSEAQRVLLLDYLSELGIIKTDLSKLPNIKIKRHVLLAALLGNQIASVQKNNPFFNYVGDINLHNFLNSVDSDKSKHQIATKNNWTKVRTVFINMISERDKASFGEKKQYNSIKKIIDDLTEKIKNAKK